MQRLKGKATSILTQGGAAFARYAPYYRISEMLSSTSVMCFDWGSFLLQVITMTYIFPRDYMMLFCKRMAQVKAG
jgi:hypothetical protein